MKKIIAIALITISFTAFSQEKNFIDKPYIEVQGKADTLVVPDKIYISVSILEKDTKGKKSVESLEKDMIGKLKQIGIDTDKNITIEDLSSNFKKYILKATDIQKSKSYSILVSSGKMASKVFIALEEIGISNATIEKAEYSGYKKMQLLLNSKAMVNAKENAASFVKSGNQKIGNALFISNLQTAGTDTYSNRLTIRAMADSTDYESSLDFEKINIESEVMVRFALE